MTFNFKSCPPLFGLVLAGLFAGCGDQDNNPSDAPDAGPNGAQIHASDVPIDGLNVADVASFDVGDDAFDVPFAAVDGLGPLYVRSACGDCHDGAARGPGLTQKMSVVNADGYTMAADQSALPWGHTIRQGLTAGAITPIVPPTGNLSVKVTSRIGPPVLGRGYMEAIEDSEIVRMQTEQAARTDGIHGQINRVVYASVAATDGFSTYVQGDSNIIGRFGLKAHIPTLDDFAADAFQGDMGLTTPMRPTEPANPDGLTDDARPGVDLDIDHVNRVAFYLRRIAIPKRVGLTTAGANLFNQLTCNVCHAPSLHTRADYPIAQLADIDAPVYTDMLLHDMGPAMADGLDEQSATSIQWRTTPLIGERFSKVYLHDGRVTTIRDAILAHGGEAAAALAAFNALSADDQATLVQFVQAL